MDFDFGQISELLENMSPEEMENLQQAAQIMFAQFGGAEESDSRAQPPPSGGDPGLGGMFTPEMLARLAQLMQRMQRPDPRTDLIQALKPHLSRRRQFRAEQAMQMMKMFELLPTLQEALK